MTPGLKKRNPIVSRLKPETADLPAMDEELAKWIQETGRRGAPRAPRELSAEIEHRQPAVANVPSPLLDGLRRPLLLGMLALAFLQYFFAAVSLKILSLPALIVFVFQ